MVDTQPFSYHTQIVSQLILIFFPIVAQPNPRRASQILRKGPARTSKASSNVPALERPGQLPVWAQEEETEAR